MMKKTLSAISLIFLTAPVWAAVPVPDYAIPDQGQQVILNIPQLRLFLFQDGKLIKSYPMTVGKASTQTPLGEFKIGTKIYKPTWSVPKSIQKEMAATGKPVQTSVPPGPSNPLGPVFVRLGPTSMGIGIHGTNAPSSIPGVRSHGCVRLLSQNALDFANTVQTGIPAAVIYQQASVNVDEDNDVWVATYRNPYSQKKLDNSLITQSIQIWAKDHHLNINQKRLNNILAKPSSLLCVTCKNGKTKIKGDLHSLAWASGKGERVELKTEQQTVLPQYNHSTEINSIPEGTSVEVNEDFNNIPASQEQILKPLPHHSSSKPVNNHNSKKKMTSPNHHFDLLL